jgi:hypothetical protein
LSGSQVRLEGELASDLAALHHGVDIALSLSLLEAVLSGELRHEIVVVLERGQTCSENLPRFNRISLQTICLVLADVSGFATVACEATSFMQESPK